MKTIFAGILLFFSVYCFAQTGTTLYQIQVGAFRETTNSERALYSLRSVGLNAVSENHMGLTRVRVTGINARQLPVLLNTLRSLGFSDPWVRDEAPIIAQPPAPSARLIGAAPVAGSPRVYSLQVGAFRDRRNAVNTFERLRNAGLSPSYVWHEDFYRVMLPNLRTIDIPTIAQTLGNLGFPEAIVRTEAFD